MAVITEQARKPPAVEVRTVAEFSRVSKNYPGGLFGRKRK